MSFEFNVNDDDYLKFNLYCMQSLPQWKTNILKYRLCLPLIYIAICIMLIVGDCNSELLTICGILCSIVSIIWIIAAPKIYYNVIKKTILKQLNSDQTLYSKQGTIILDDNQISCHTERTDLSHNYSSIEKIVLSDNDIYIFTSSVTAIILSKDTLSHIDRDQLNEFLKTKIAKEKFVTI